MGRWLSFFTTGIADTSNVLRVAVSNVRMPRSQRMTSGLPPARMYSAESSHSSMVAGRQSGRRIVEFQGVQFLLADLASELALCERWLWHVGALIDAGENDIGIEASLLKLRASDLAMRITTEVVQLFGGYGYCKDQRAERLMRDAKITQIWEGTNQIHRQLIGRSFIER
jgi:acyl-CoA dehydrogenase